MDIAVGILAFLFAILLFVSMAQSAVTSKGLWGWLWQLAGQKQLGYSIAGFILLAVVWTIGAGLFWKVRPWLALLWFLVVDGGLGYVVKKQLTAEKPKTPGI